MTQGKHTPGEWVGDRGFRDAMCGPDHTTIEDNFVTVLCGDDALDNFDPDKSDFIEVHGPNQNANARLIAAAPEMFGALRDLVSWYGPMHMMPPEIRGAWMRAENAIAKAEGKP